MRLGCKALHVECAANADRMALVFNTEYVAVNVSNFDVVDAEAEVRKYYYCARNFGAEKRRCFLHTTFVPCDQIATF